MKLLRISLILSVYSVYSVGQLLSLGQMSPSCCSRGGRTPQGSVEGIRIILYALGRCQAPSLRK